MDTWKRVWRDAVAGQLTTAGLEALRQALATDDPRLLQGSTTDPPPLMCVQDWAVEGACVVGYCGWQGDGLQTVGEVEEYFFAVCQKIDEVLGDSAGCRYFLNWFDETPREEVRRELLPEVEREIGRRREAATVAVAPAG